jgi:hypothetical protein
MRLHGQQAGNCSSRNPGKGISLKYFPPFQGGVVCKIKIFDTLIGDFFVFTPPSPIWERVARGRVRLRTGYEELNKSLEKNIIF